MHDIAIRQEIVDRVIAKRSRLHLSKGPYDPYLTGRGASGTVGG